MAGDKGATARWNSSDDGQYTILSAALQNPQAFSEVNDLAEDATQFYAFKRINGTASAWQIGEVIPTRAWGINASMMLNNTQDIVSRAVVE